MSPRTTKPTDSCGVMEISREWNVRGALSPLFLKFARGFPGP
jgi:hypothetical protein